MFIYISSGNGVEEVCRGVYKFVEYLKKGYKFTIIEIVSHNTKNSYKSVLLQSDDINFLKLRGTILWKTKSPLRKSVKRVNWYFSVEIYDENKNTIFDEAQIIYQTMKSPKKGGQHVNKTSSGVRALYPPLDIEAISYDERSQHKNKQIACIRLKQKFEQLQVRNEKEINQKYWKGKKNIIRGNPVKVFCGTSFEELG